MCAEDFSVNRRTRLRGWFLGRQRLCFVNDLWVSNSLGAQKVSNSAVELGSDDDFWVGSDSVFLNDFWVISSLCVPKISALAIELGCVDDLWVVIDSVSSMIYESAVV